jgi:hypothetical protein
MSLSVKSMHSCSRAAPRFSMAGILWPVVSQEVYVSTVAILSFSGNRLGAGHTS